jgi:hypothetical protein
MLAPALFTLYSIIIYGGVQVPVTNQIYPPRQALDIRYQVLDQILTKCIQTLKNVRSYKIYVEFVQERHFLRMKKQHQATRKGGGGGGSLGCREGRRANQIHTPGEARDNSNLPPRQVKEGLLLWNADYAC